MTKHKHKTAETASVTANAANEVVKPAPVPEGETASPAQAPESAAAVSSAEAAQKEASDLKDKLLRAMAETENTRRRFQKEIEDTRKYAVSNFAKEMLIVADNFRRALEAIPKEKGDDETLKHLVMGVEATERQLLATFERFGIKKIDPLGQIFDPNYHRVMMEMEDTDQPAGTVVQVIQAGYMIQDRLLREALVAVAKAGPSVTTHKVDTEA